MELILVLLKLINAPYRTLIFTTFLKHSSRYRDLCIYRVRLKKMTQHVKCDYSVMPENFCAKFCTLV